VRGILLGRSPRILRLQTVFRILTSAHSCRIRVERALKLFELRRQASEALHLLDCLQFCDKRDLVLRVPGCPEQLGFSDSKSALRLFRDIEALRNRIAHAQDVVEGITWTDFFFLTETMDRILRRCEAIGSPPTSG